ncbi:hypothetical protein [Methanoculleus sp.]|uniref:hypothetical protein n=1 Tax=Methanoculleus sp. TaxID=90427 RepID=UPI00272EB5F2|nr:hypothetical protein [Methanoculleus sp.]
MEIWKKIVDACGNTVGVSTAVANMGRGEYGMTYDRDFRLPEGQMMESKEIARLAFADLRLFMEALLSSGDITTLVVFAADMERKAFHLAGVPFDQVDLIDLQREIKRQFRMKHVLSLDRLSRLIEFRVEDASIASAHFRYAIPDQYRYHLEPHRGMGDAARIFLLSREYTERRAEFRAWMRVLIDICEGMRARRAGRRSSRGRWGGEG